MSRASLLLYPNAELTMVSDPVDPHWAGTSEFKDLVQDMVDTLLYYGGVGLSAIQIGVPDRVFCMRTKDGVTTFVNPEITNVDDETVPMKEGCLSLPGVVETVERYPWIVLQSDVLVGETFERKSFDMVGVEAQCAQHEMDHLDGKMFSDGYGPVKRDIVRRKIRKQLRTNPRFRS